MKRVDKAKRFNQMTDFEDGKTGLWVEESGAEGSSIELVGGNHVFRVPLLVPRVELTTVLSQKKIRTLQGQKYRFSLKVRLHEEGDANPVITLQVQGENGGTTIITDTEWLTISIDFVAPALLTDLSIAGTYFDEGPGRVIELDDILVFAVFEPSAELK